MDLSAIRTGTYDIELGPAGGIQTVTWTCPFCGREMDGSALSTLVDHRLDCSERPHADQSTLTAYPEGCTR